MLHRLLCALLPLAVTGFAFAASAAPQEAPADPVVARVNGSEIHRSDVEHFYAGLPAQVQQVPIAAIFPMLVDRLVERKLFADAGYKAKLQQSAVVQREVHQAEERAVEEAYLEGEMDRRITPEALDAAYKTFVADFKPKDEVKAAHILVTSEAEAKAIIAQLKKGADFAKIAREKSKDSGSAEKGGDLGYFDSDTMVEPFSKAVFAMKAGEVSKTPVKTQFGWHVIKVEDRRLSVAPKPEEIKSELEDKIRDAAANDVVKALRATASIETFQADGSPLPAKK
jgi:peptidyl-prolyl cis-trans isomerase C